jgi:predicted small lipoprotein YifL
MTRREWALYLLIGFLLTFMAVGTLSMCARMGPLYNTPAEAPAN